MESTLRRQAGLIAMWSLIVASLLMSITSLSRSHYKPQLEELKNLEDRTRQVEIDLHKLAGQLESKVAK